MVGGIPPNFLVFQSSFEIYVINFIFSIVKELVNYLIHVSD